MLENFKYSTYIYCIEDYIHNRINPYNNYMKFKKGMRYMCHFNLDSFPTKDYDYVIIWDENHNHIMFEAHHIGIKDVIRCFMSESEYIKMRRNKINKILND